MSSNTRLIEESHLPDTLWDRATGTLRLPPALVRAYSELIRRLGLQEVAEARDPRNPSVGGVSQEEAQTHFAQQFDGSVARAQLALLDPGHTLAGASDSFLLSLAGNTAGVTDAPCGAAAASLGFLAAVAELRATNVLPRYPLDVTLIGAELSEPARNLAQGMLDGLQGTLEAQGMFVTAHLRSWDATDALSNTDLIGSMRTRNRDLSAQVLLVANFSGFLERCGKRKQVEPQLAELFRHASGPRCSVMWMEPGTNEVTRGGGMFEWLAGKIRKWKLFARLLLDDATPHAVTTSHFYRALDPSDRVRVSLAILPIDLSRSK